MIPVRGSARHLAPVFCVLLVVGGLAVVPAWSSVPAGKARGATSGGDDPLAVALLHRAMEATARVSYQGTQYVAAWSSLDRSVSTSAVLEVSHPSGGPTTVHAVGAGPASVVEEGPDAAWLADPGGPVELLVRAYDVVVADRGTVAGRPVQVVEALRPDGSTAARLWLDDETALPLRREVYDEDGATVTASAFVEISVQTRGSRPGAGGVARGSTGPGAANRLTHGDLARLRERGWRCPTRLGDRLVLYDAKLLGEAVQLSYSDGVATVSVFTQQGRLDKDRLAGFETREIGEGVVYASPGPPSTYTWSTGDRVVTVIADGPVTGVEGVLTAMPPEPLPEEGLLARIGRGAERLRAWLDPFD